MFVSSMCQMSFLPYTQSYMGTGINFQPAPIFRTGVIHFCHPGQFWNCILPFSYTSKFLRTVLLQFSFYSLISQFSRQYFQECTLTLFILKRFPGQFHRIVLLHFSTVAHFQNWTIPFLSSQPILELYPSIFLHKPIFGTVLFRLSF